MWMDDQTSVVTFNMFWLSFEPDVLDSVGDNESLRSVVMQPCDYLLRLAHLRTSGCTVGHRPCATYRARMFW